MIKISDISQNKVKLYLLLIFLSFLAISFAHSHHHHYEFSKSSFENPSDHENLKDPFLDSDFNCTISSLSNSIFKMEFLKNEIGAKLNDTFIFISHSPPYLSLYFCNAYSLRGPPQQLV